MTHPPLNLPLEGGEIKVPPLQGEARWGWAPLIAAGIRALKQGMTKRPHVETVIIIIALFISPGCVDTKSPCDIDRGHCSQETEKGVTISFDILPKPVRIMSDVTFIVTVTKENRLMDDAIVFLDLSMPGMYMGRNQSVLMKTASGRYEGTGVIPRCPRGGRTWQAKVTVDLNGKTTVADYIFEVH